MAEATVAFGLGLETVTSVLEIDLEVVTPISGNFAGLIPAGTTARILGDVNLTGDLIVEGLLTGIDTFELEGNGFQILVQNGGRVQLAGVPKMGWVPAWGDPVSGWNTNDRLAVAPTAPSVTTLQPLKAWSGSWGALSRPANSPDVTLFNGDVHKPEVANLDRTINFRNLSRFHLHDGAGVQTLKHLALVDCGVQDLLAHYPLHFHLNGETSRGSLIEGVVIERGKNHAFVPHGSHEITMRDCVAYDTTGDVYWWDPPDPNFPPDPNYPDYKDNPSNPNNSNDLLFDRCLVLGTDHPTNPPRLTGFFISGGTNNKWVGNVAVGVQGGKSSSGFRWLEHFVAVFDGGNKAHNCRSDGIFTWTNSPANHTIDGFVSYRNRRAGIEHGAYVNSFIYRNVVIHMEPIVATGSDLTNAILEHAMSKGRGLLFENIVSNDRLTIAKHSVLATRQTIHRNCTYTGVLYQEGSAAGEQASDIRFEDCGLVPEDFNMTGAKLASIAEIYEGGVLLHRWTNGVWT